LRWVIIFIIFRFVARPREERPQMSGSWPLDFNNVRILTLLSPTRGARVVSQKCAGLPANGAVFFRVHVPFFAPKWPVWPRGKRLERSENLPGFPRLSPVFPGFRKSGKWEAARARPFNRLCEKVVFSSWKKWSVKWEAALSPALRKYVSFAKVRSITCEWWVLFRLHVPFFAPKWPVWSRGKRLERSGNPAGFRRFSPVLAGCLAFAEMRGWLARAP